ncbi:MAG: 1-acyl-sn-glycerol-3-phosphate acyltransferase [Methylophagaceae bacterium]
MTQKICAYILYNLLGWRVEGEIPHSTKRLMLLYLPHTSNWDFVYGMLFVKAENIKATVFGKDGFYFFPFTYIYKYFKVVPIKRNQKNNFVEQAIALFDNGVPLWTGMAPEGTRSKTNHLKSGYYYLAKGAKIPVVLVGLDFQKKALVILPPRAVFETLEEDQANLMAFSRSLAAKRPELAI